MMQRIAALFGALSLAAPALAQTSPAPAAGPAPTTDSGASPAAAEAPPPTAQAPAAEPSPAPTPPTSVEPPAPSSPTTTPSAPATPEAVSPAPLPPRRPRETEADQPSLVQRRPGPRDIAVQLGAGVNGRFGHASGYAEDSGIGPSYALGAWFGASSAIALGLELSYTRLGHGSAESGINVVNTEFASSAAWLAGRFFPYRTPDLSIYLGLRVGLALEHVSATGLAQSGESPLVRAAVIDCSGTRGPALGLGGGLGGVLALSSHLDLVSELGVRAEQLTADRVGGCANGVGSTTSLGFGLGIAYGFDVDAGSAQARAPASRAQTW